MRLLVKGGIDVNAKDDEGKTALDILNPHNSREIKGILLLAKALKGDSLPYSNPYTDGHMHRLMSNLSLRELCEISLIRSKNNIKKDTRNVILLVATLIVTATYQAALSPPGGLWQEDSTSNGNNNNNIPKIRRNNIAVNRTSSTSIDTTTCNNYNGGSSTSELELLILPLTNSTNFISPTA